MSVEAKPEMARWAKKKESIGSKRIAERNAKGIKEPFLMKAKDRTMKDKTRSFMVPRL